MEKEYTDEEKWALIRDRENTNQKLWVIDKELSKYCDFVDECYKRVGTESVEFMHITRPIIFGFVDNLVEARYWKFRYNSLGLSNKSDFEYNSCANVVFNECEWTKVTKKELGETVVKASEHIRAANDIIVKELLNKK